jgi:hypothetical protein
MVGRSRATAMALALGTLGAVSCASTAGGARPVVERASGVSSIVPQQSIDAPRASLQAIPESLRAACGHPGAQAVLTAVPITVPKAQCDLTGVVVLYGGVGVTVPSDGGVEGIADGISSSSELGANVDPITGDVTFS